MSESCIGLPPDLYYITVTNIPGYIVPGKSEAALQLVDDSAKKKWKFTGDGKFICPSNSFYAYSPCPAVDAQVLGAAKSPLTWNVKVVDNKDGSFKGTIMTSDSQVIYWFVNNNCIVLKGNPMEFVFTSA